MEILANPRYTGRPVWNRQRTDHYETIPGNKQSSLGPTRAWNPKSEWVISTDRVHPALISDADFLATQTVTALAVLVHLRSRNLIIVCSPTALIVEGKRSAETVNPHHNHPSMG